MLINIITTLSLIFHNVLAQNDYTYDRLIKIHASLMTITFLLLIPIGIFFSRFGSKNLSRWVKIHMVLMLSAATFPLLTAFLCAYFATTPDNFTSNHTKIGFTIFLLIWIQIFLGLVNHIIYCYRTKRNNVPLTRPWHNYIHIWLGRIIFFLGICNIPIGLKLYDVPIFYYILYAIWTFILICLLIILEVYTRHKITNPSETN